MNPRTLWACQLVACMSALRLAPVGRRSSAITLAVLLPRRALGRAAHKALVLEPPLLDATCRRCPPPSGFKFWIAFQIRVTATGRLVKRLTGFTPGRLFHIWTSRSTGHFAVRVANSCALVNVSLVP